MFLEKTDLFFENVDLLLEKTDLFFENVDLFSGNVDLFSGNVDLFSKKTDLFLEKQINVLPKMNEIMRVQTCVSENERKTKILLIAKNSRILAIQKLRYVELKNTKPHSVKESPKGGGYLLVLF